MLLLLVLAGLILMLAGGTWFTGAATVGLICLIVGGVCFLLQIVIAAFITASTSGMRKEVKRSLRDGW